MAAAGLHSAHLSNFGSKVSLPGSDYFIDASTKSSYSVVLVSRQSVVKQNVWSCRFLVKCSGIEAARNTITALKAAVQLKRCTMLRKNVARHPSVGVRCSLTAGHEGPAEAGTRPPSEKVSIGAHNGQKLEISRVVNGMWQVSGGWGHVSPEHAVDSMIQHADNGFTTFDMADHYGPAEELYGQFINRLRREREEEASKVQGLTKWVPMPGRMTRQVVEENVDKSRRLMDVACLDMMQFHWWEYENKGYLDALKHMTDLKEEGKIKLLSLTNFDTKRLQIILEEGIPIATNQVQHSLVDMRPQAEMAKLCEITGVRLITYGTVMGGLLSEKYLHTRDPSNMFGGPPLNTPSLNKYKRMVDAWGGWELFQELLRETDRVAKKHEVTIPLVAIKYILDQPAVAGSMVGVRFGLSEHIKDNKKVFSLALDEDDRGRIDSVLRRGKDLLRSIGDCGDEYRRA